MTHFDFMPELVNNEGNVVRIEFGYKAVEVEQMPMRDGEESTKRTEYQGYTARIQQPLNYGKVVSAIIRAKYSADEVEAIMLNMGDGNAEHEAEYKALQDWRTKAKEIAKLVMK